MKRIALLTSGGDSPGMNAGIRAVVRAAHAKGLDIFGVDRGFQGLIDNHMKPMGSRDVGGIIHLGGTILHTARCEAFLQPEARARAADHIRKNEIDGLVIIGGEGSYLGAEALEAEQNIPCIGMPGTIDNDIGGTDLTIGFDTALNTALEAIDRLRDTAQSHDRTFFVEVMGRHNGYIAMLSGIAGGAENVLVPEYPTDIDKLIENLRRSRERGKMSSIIVVAEGDDAGNAIEIARKVADRSEFKETRVTVVGHLQRGGSPTALDRILASRFGARAVEALLHGERAKMTAIVDGKVVLRPLSNARDIKSRFDPAYMDLMHDLAQ